MLDNGIVNNLLSGSHFQIEKRTSISTSRIVVMLDLLKARVNNSFCVSIYIKQLVTAAV